MNTYYFIEEYIWNEVLDRQIWTPKMYFSSELNALKVLEDLVIKERGTYKITKVYTHEADKPDF